MKNITKNNYWKNYRNSVLRIYTKNKSSKVMAMDK